MESHITVGKSCESATVSGASSSTAFKARIDCLVCDEQSTRLLSRVWAASDGRTLMRTPSNFAFVMASASV
jgi:hypothetical protein